MAPTARQRIRRTPPASTRAGTTTSARPLGGARSRTRPSERARAGGDRWAQYGGATAAEHGRPDDLAATQAPELRTQAANADELTDAIRETIGGDQRVYRPGGLPAVVNAEALGRHLEPSRARHLPLLNETLKAPQEVWVAFERNRDTGKIRLRTRVIRRFDDDRGGLVVLESQGGLLVGWTFLATRDRGYLDRQRRGQLVFTGSDE